MNKTVLKTICIVSGILLGILCVIWGISIVQVTKTANAASMGIIGGADGPTALYLMQKLLRSPVCYTTIAAFLVFVGTGLTLIFRRNKK